jgi:hypothetical protein
LLLAAFTLDMALPAQPSKTRSRSSCFAADLRPGTGRGAFISVDADGRLRVTKDGFPVLDAVVADLAA